jgi:hypothetical protein
MKSKLLNVLQNSLVVLRKENTHTEQITLLFTLMAVSLKTQTKTQKVPKKHTSRKYFVAVLIYSVI